MPPKKRTRRGFGAIAKLPSGRYRARYTGPDLAWHNAPTTYKAKIDAEGWIASERKLIELGTWTPPATRGQKKDLASRTITEAVTDYIVARDLRRGSAETYRSTLSTRIDPYLGTATVGGINRHDVEKWTQSMRRDHPETQSRNSQAYRLLASTMKREVDREIIEVSPCQSPEAGRKPKPAETPLLTADEYRTLVDSLPENYRLMAHVMAGCALRLGEITELRVSDYRTVSPDPLVSTVSVSRAASWVRGQWVVGKPKSEAGIRTVTVPPHIAEPLRDLIKLRMTEGSDALIFPNGNGTRVRPQGFRSTFSRAATKAGRPDVSPHDLRHYGAVMASRAGATLKELQARLGHETPTMAMHYQHVSEGRDAEIAARMSEMYGGG